ncbi:MAG TPA: hypothetical protein VFA31_02495 [Candidatus Polarisedimenticolia bacterium]|jgi:hypothetical protein|nr:hypothetical protein [Candidatus Polarisedimenticolia bacterium]
MPVLRDRDGDPARAAAELEDRPAGATRKAAEPLDVWPALERGVIEVVQRREARGLARVALGTLPITKTCRREPPSPA